MPRIRKDKTARSYAEPFWKIGLYIRLSKEDDNEDESESVINQEKILRDFVDSYFEPGTFVIVDVFADDGLTGTDTALSLIHISALGRVKNTIDVLFDNAVLLHLLFRLAVILIQFAFPVV